MTEQERAEILDRNRGELMQCLANAVRGEGLKVEEVVGLIFTPDSGLQPEPEPGDFVACLHQRDPWLQQFGSALQGHPPDQCIWVIVASRSGITCRGLTIYLTTSMGGQS